MRWLDWPQRLSPSTAAQVSKWLLRCGMYVFPAFAVLSVLLVVGVTGPSMVLGMSFAVMVCASALAMIVAVELAEQHLLQTEQLRARASQRAKGHRRRSRRHLRLVAPPEDS